MFAPRQRSMYRYAVANVTGLGCPRDPLHPSTGMMLGTIQVPAEDGAQVLLNFHSKLQVCFFNGEFMASVLRGED